MTKAVNAVELLVCMKQVPDDLVKVPLAEDGTPALDGIEAVVNAYDTYALEMAVRLKEAVGGTITVVSIGGDGVIPSLRSCLAVGADAACRVEGDGGDSSRRKSALLAQTLAQSGKTYDLIFCGMESTDSMHGQFGARLAKHLDLPLITGVVKVEACEGGILACQEMSGGYRSIKSACPCVVTVSKPEYDPRYPTIKSKMAARKAQIPSLEAENAALPEDDVVLVSRNQPSQSRDGVKIQEKEPDEAVGKLLNWMTDKGLM